MTAFVRKFKVAKTKRPKGVPKDLDVTWCKTGFVYNIYQCCKCIYEHQEDLKRPRRIKFVKVTKRRKKQVSICSEHGKELLIKYKKCTCGQTYWGFSLKGGSTCKLCSSFSLQKIKKKNKLWYRLNVFYKKTHEDLSDLDRWDCKNRSLCLECTHNRGANKAVACKNCPDYQRGIL